MGMDGHPVQTGEAPKKSKTDSYSPSQKRPSVAALIWRTRTRRLMGLAHPGVEDTRIRSRSLLIHNRCRHNVCGPTSVTSVRIQFRFWCHFVVSGLAASCNTSLSDCDSNAAGPAGPVSASQREAHQSSEIEKVA